jgi:hypothetical protein
MDNKATEVDSKNIHLNKIPNDRETPLFVLETSYYPNAVMDVSAGVVHVDPDFPGVGTVVDLASLTKRQLLKAHKKSSSPYETYVRLGRKPSILSRIKQCIGKVLGKVLGKGLLSYIKSKLIGG